jgi:hypothetical protein
MVISNFFPVVNLLAPTVCFNVGQSYLLFAALIVLALLHTARPGWQLGSLHFGGNRGRSRPLGHQ